MLDKSLVHASLLEEVQSRIERIQKSIDDSQQSMRNETKSTAGDKHETARAMAQLEQEKLGKQLSTLITLRKGADRISLEQKHEQVQFGSLIETDKGIYFLSVGIGKLQVDGQSIFCLSATTPLGQQLLSKKANDKVTFNGNQMTIRSIQ